MIIKKSTALPFAQAKNTNSSKKISIIRQLMIILSACIISSLITVFVAVKYQASENHWSPSSSSLASWAHRKGYWSTITSVGPFKALLSAPGNILSFGKSQEIPKIAIDIKFKHLQKIFKIRDRALAKGALIQGEDDFVPALIRHGNRAINVKLRLKGDATDHLQENKWSYRVHVKGKDQIFGLRRFSIQAPWVRAFHAEMLFGETLRHVGVLVPQYFFVNLVFNGDDIGVMAIEEHFSKELLENSGRREGVIVRFDDSLMWAKQILENNQKNLLVGWSKDNYITPFINSFRSSRIGKSEKLSKDLTIAIGLLRAFQKKKLAASEVFDVEKIGSFLAVAELWGALHSTAWTNLVLYLNPITMKIEPIGYDGALSMKAQVAPGEIKIGSFDMNKALLSSPEIFSAYVKTLRNLAKDILEGDLIAKLKSIEQKFLPILQKEAFLLSEFPWESIVERADNLLQVSKNKKYLLELVNYPNETPKLFPTLLNVYNIGNQDPSFLELENLTGYEVEVQSIKWISKKDGNSLAFKSVSKIEFPIRFSPTSFSGTPKTLRLFYKPLVNQNLFSLQVTANIRGQRHLYKSFAMKYYPILQINPVPKTHLNEQLTKHPFLTFIQNERALHIQKGKWAVKGLLVLPVGVSLTIPAGTTLEFEHEGGIIARGPLYFQGEENTPILLKGIAGAGSDALWQGIAVLGSEITSEWTHVSVLNTVGIQHEGWELTGGVTFYRSNINMKNCVFHGNRAEDALNIIHSKFQLADIEFRDTFSDGFDADYSEGEIENSSFENIGMTGGGDGLDISFSNVTANNVRFQNIVDKALSVGEKSRMKATHINIEGAGTGVTSKDGSFLDISNSTIKRSKVAGMMAYVKKPEFGSASIEANNIAFTDSIRNTWSQNGNSITINGKKVEGEAIDIEQLYEKFMKGSLNR